MRRGGTVQAFLCTSRWHPSPPTLYPTRSTHLGRILSPPANSATSAVEQCRHLSSHHNRLVVALCGFSPSHLPPPPPPILPLLINDNDVQGIVVEMPSTPPIIFFLTAGTPRLALLASQWHREVLPPCHCGARIASMRYKCHAFNAKGVDFGGEGDRQNWRRGEKRLPPVGE